MSPSVVKKVAGLVLVGALSAGLAGCGHTDAPAQPSATPGLSSSTVKLPDGRSVVCVTLYDKGVSCDWAGTK